MGMGAAFWVCWLIWLVLGLGLTFPRGEGAVYYPWFGSLLLFILVTLLGWHAFGPPLQG